MVCAVQDLRGLLVFALMPSLRKQFGLKSNVICRRTTGVGADCQHADVCAAYYIISIPDTCHLLIQRVCPSRMAYLLVLISVDP